MNILPVNGNNKTNFKGNIITKGSWPKFLKESFENNPEVKKLASGNYNVIGKMSYRKAAYLYDRRHYPGEETFKLKLLMQKEKPTFWEKFKNLLGLNPSVQVTHRYHRDTTTDSLMYNRINAEKYLKQMNVEIKNP